MVVVAAVSRTWCRPSATEDVLAVVSVVSVVWLLQLPVVGGVLFSRGRSRVAVEVLVVPSTVAPEKKYSSAEVPAVHGVEVVGWVQGPHSSSYMASLLAGHSTRPASSSPAVRVALSPAAAHTVPVVPVGGLRPGHSEEVDNTVGEKVGSSTGWQSRCRGQQAVQAGLYRRVRRVVLR